MRVLTFFLLAFSSRPSRPGEALVPRGPRDAGYGGDAVGSAAGAEVPEGPGGEGLARA